MKHTVDEDVAAFDGEVNAVLACAAAIEFRFATGEDPKFICEAFLLIDFLRLDVQRLQQRELGLRGKFGEFGGTDFIEDDLEHDEHLSEGGGRRQGQIINGFFRVPPGIGCASISAHGHVNIPVEQHTAILLSGGALVVESARLALRGIGDGGGISLVAIFSFQQS